MNALTLDKAVHGIVETGGVNRNRYVRSATGNQASCLIRGKQGRWIAPARDRSAR